MKIAKSLNRLGTEAVYDIFAETKKLIEQGKKIIDLSLGQSDFKSPNHVVEAESSPGTFLNIVIERRRSLDDWQLFWYLVIVAAHHSNASLFGSMHAVSSAVSCWCSIC